MSRSNELVTLLVHFSDSVCSNRLSFNAELFKSFLQHLKFNCNNLKIYIDLQEFSSVPERVRNLVLILVIRQQLLFQLSIAPNPQSHDEARRAEEFRRVVLVFRGSNLEVPHRVYQSETGEQQSGH